MRDLSIKEVTDVAGASPELFLTTFLVAGIIGSGFMASNGINSYVSSYNYYPNSYSYDYYVYDYPTPFYYSNPYNPIYPGTSTVVVDYYLY